MQTCKINFYTYNYINTPAGNNHAGKCTPASGSIQKSLYKEKGVHIPFCGLAKGQDFIEESCISMLRKVRENRFRKFAEDDIREILADLKKSKSPDEKPHIIQEALTLEDEAAGGLPSKNFIKKVIKLTAGKSEEERFALLEFAQRELQTSTAPLEAFSKISEEKQTKLTRILTAINDANETKYYKSKDAQTKTIDSIYDIFNTAVYAHDDLPKLDINEADKYKLNALKILHSDKKYIQNMNTFSDENAKTKILNIADSIMNYFFENII